MTILAKWIKQKHAFWFTYIRAWTSATSTCIMSMWKWDLNYFLLLSFIRLRSISVGKNASRHTSKQITKSVRMYADIDGSGQLHRGSIKRSDAFLFLFWVTAQMRYSLQYFIENAYWLKLLYSFRNRCFITSMWEIGPDHFNKNATPDWPIHTQIRF